MTTLDFFRIDWKRDLFPYLPPGVRTLLDGVDRTAPLEEIRVRAGKPLQLCFTGYERLLYGPGGGPAATAEDCEQMLTLLCQQSVYAWEEELKNGFLTLEGGYRVGLCGRGEMGGANLERLGCVTSFNIRIARQAPGVAAELLPRLLDGWGGLLSTLIVSPPGCGKTTMLRDMARLCSLGQCGARPSRVALVDTRYELAGAVRGVGTLDVGPRTDVLSGVPKGTGIRMMVTGMAPDLLVTDELATVDEANAALEAAACGTAVAASAHAGGCGSLRRRETLRLLLAAGLFQRIVVLGRSRGVGTVEQVLDGEFHRLDREGSACCGQ